MGDQGEAPGYWLQTESTPAVVAQQIGSLLSLFTLCNFVFPTTTKILKKDHIPGVKMIVLGKVFQRSGLLEQF